MNDKLGRQLFKSGGVFMVLTGLVHAISLFVKQVPANETERKLLDLMVNYKFNLLGSVRSMDNLLQGFSAAFMLAALVVGAMALAFSSERSGLLKRVALVIALWLASMTAVSLRYFFVVPTSFLSVGLLIFLLAWINLPAEEAK
jgi:hypothetical protein